MDAIFIDGDHSYDAVSLDLDFALAKVKSGGKIMGDDYWITDVAKAVNDFANKNGLTVEIANPDSHYPYIFSISV